MKWNEQIDFACIILPLYDRKQKILLRSLKMHTLTRHREGKRRSIIHFNRENWVEQFHTFLEWYKKCMVYLVRKWTDMNMVCGGNIFCNAKDVLCYIMLVCVFLDDPQHRKCYGVHKWNQVSLLNVFFLICLLIKF